MGAELPTPLVHQPRHQPIGGGAVQPERVAGTLPATPARALRLPRLPPAELLRVGPELVGTQVEVGHGSLMEQVPETAVSELS